MSFTGPVEDQLALRTLHDAYADAVFRRDAQAWGALWAEDAVWNLGQGDVTGKDKIVPMWIGAMGMFSQVAFFCQPGALEVDGDAASGRVYTQEVLTEQDGTLRRIVGCYEDTYVRRDGRWLFSSRRYTILKGH
jgi:ketosteroid isomerase-like protein